MYKTGAPDLTCIRSPKKRHTSKSGGMGNADWTKEGLFWDPDRECLLSLQRGSQKGPIEQDTLSRQAGRLSPQHGHLQQPPGIESDRVGSSNQFWECHAYWYLSVCVCVCVSLFVPYVGTPTCLHPPPQSRPPQLVHVLSKIRSFRLEHVRHCIFVSGHVAKMSGGLSRASACHASTDPRHWTASMNKARLPSVTFVLDLFEDVTWT